LEVVATQILEDGRGHGCIGFMDGGTLVNPIQLRYTSESWKLNVPEEGDGPFWCIELHGW